MEGYDAVGAIMGAYPGLSIFRKFGALNSRYILFLQAQLAEKEGKLLSAIASDRDSQDEERKSFSFNFDTMMSSKSVPPDGEDSQRELMLEIGPLLGSYCMCPDFTPLHLGDKPLTIPPCSRSRPLQTTMAFQASFCPQTSP
jgi:hypothetical protein